MNRSRCCLIAVAVLAAVPATAQNLTLYSGRGETLVAPVVAAFTEETGIEVDVRYAGTSELAVLLQEEGEASPADLFWSQDPGALGAVADLLAELPAEITDLVSPALRDEDGRWIATSGRQRVLVVSTERVEDGEIPASILDLTGDEYRGRVGWAPTNGSFQLHVTAMREALGEEETREWLEAMVANEAVVFSNNAAIVQGIADGEADFGLVNNYYLPRFLASDPEFPVKIAHFADGDIGNLLSVAAIGVTASSDQQEEAAAFVEFLLSPQTQQYFASQVKEYAVTSSVVLASDQPTLDTLEVSAPDIDLNSLSDLEGTLELLREAGLL